MEINFNVKVKSGKRTDIEVKVYTTSVNPKKLQFIHTDKEMEDQRIANYIENSLTEALKNYK